MPTAWLKKRVLSGDPFHTIQTVAREAQVSFQAATIKVLGSMEKGNIYAQLQDGFVVSSGRSPQTLTTPPHREALIKPESEFDWTPHRWSCEVGPSTYYFTGGSLEDPSL